MLAQVQPVSSEAPAPASSTTGAEVQSKALQPSRKAEEFQRRRAPSASSHLLPLCRSVQASPLPPGLPRSCTIHLPSSSDTAECRAQRRRAWRCWPSSWRPEVGGRPMQQRDPVPHTAPWQASRLPLVWPDCVLVRLGSPRVQTGCKDLALPIGVSWVSWVPCRR